MARAVFLWGILVLCGVHPASAVLVVAGTVFMVREW